jgi:type I restriction enzyme M protein
MVSRKLRELTAADISKISDTYHAWRNSDGLYEDIAGFSKVASIDEIAKHDFVLTPSRYVGTAEAEVDEEPTSEKIQRLKTELFQEFAINRDLEEKIRVNLDRLS